ncbi:MAG: transporter substrate-binding domain-containing protein [Lachnospiraceae bacterium]
MIERTGSVLLYIVLLAGLLLTGCSSPADSDQMSGDSVEKTFDIKVTDHLQAIIDRGYLRVGCKTDVPGFGYYNEETGGYEGLEIDLAYYVAAKLFGMDYSDAREQDLVRFTGVTVEDRFDVLESGTVDCLIATVTITDEREAKYAFSDRYHVDSVGLMVLSEPGDERKISSKEITSITQLDGKIIGVPKNATTRADFIKYTELNDISVNPVFVEYNTYDALYDSLKSGKIDAFAVDRSILEGYRDSSMTILPDRFASQPYGVCALKEEKDLIDAVNVVLEELDYRGIVLEQ